MPRHLHGNRGETPAYHQLITVTAIRVAVRIAITGVGPGRTQSTLSAVSIEAPTKTTALETTVAETGVAYLYGPARRCTMAAEIAVVRLDPEVSEAVVAAETGSPKATDTASAA